MKTGWARALLAALVAVAACGKGGSGSTGDAGPMGPTDLVAKWTFTGQPASAATCMAHMGQQVYVNLSGTIDESLHQSVTADCSKGSVDLGSLLVQDLGTPYLEATLLDSMGTTVTIVGVNVTPTLGTTTVTLDFFPPPMGMGGMAATSSSTAASTAASTGAGGAGGAGGAATAASSTAASSAASSAGGDAGTDGG